MAKRAPLTEEVLRFLARTAAARDTRGFTQTKIARLLDGDMEQPTYSKYETRSPLPHWHIPRFVEFCGVSYEWLFTGEGKGPAWQPYYEALLAKLEARAQRAKKRTKKAA